MNKWISTSIISILQAVWKLTLRPKGFILQSEHILQETNISVWNKWEAFIPGRLAFI